MMLLRWLAVLALLHVGSAQAQMNSFFPGPGSPAASASPPSITYAGTVTGSTSASPQTTTFTVGATTLNMLIVKYSGATNLQPVSMSAAPNVGTTVSCTSVDYVQTASNVDAGIYYCLLLSDANTATTVTISLSWGASNPFGARQVSLWYLPAGSLSSTTPVDHKTNFTNSSGTALSIGLNTSAGGFYVVGGASNGLIASGVSYTAGETVTTDTFVAAAGAVHAAGNAQNVAAQAPDTITQTFVGSSTMVLVGASWR